MKLIEFNPAHLDYLEPLERNGHAKMRALAPALTLGFAASMEVDGTIAACGGLIPLHPGRLLAWSVITAQMPVVPGARLFRDFLDKQDAFRIETAVDCDDARSERWVRMLGFRAETPPLRGFNRDGSAARLFVRFRDGA